MAKDQNFRGGWQERLAALRNVPPVLKIVWESGPGVVTFGLVSRLFSALLPLALLDVTRLIINLIDEMVHSGALHRPVPHRLWWLVGCECTLAIGSSVLSRAIDYSDSL